MSEPPADGREVALGVVLAGFHAGAAAGRVALLPGRVALRAPVLGHFLRRAADDLAADGRRAEVWARAQLEQAAGVVLAAPEVERALDRVLAGQLTDAVARSLAEHRVAERVAAQIVATTDVDRVVSAVLENELTERALDHALESPALERLVVRVLESRLLDELTVRVLHSPEMDRVVEYIATSPQVLDAVSRQTQTLADEMVADVRRRSQTVDDIAERTVRGWLRRPRPNPS
jgi:DNA-binding FrmR family transcriptional regulator